MQGENLAPSTRTADEVGDAHVSQAGRASPLSLTIPRPHKDTYCPQIAISMREHQALRDSTRVYGRTSASLTAVS